MRNHQSGSIPSMRVRRYLQPSVGSLRPSSVCVISRLQQRLIEYRDRMVTAVVTKPQRYFAVDPDARCTGFVNRGS
jgi:hypothetical protein